MKAFAILVMLCVAAGAASADDVTKPEDSPLVKAAKASGGPKKKSKKKVITNADVKKANGKLVVLPPKPGAEVAQTSPQKSSLEKQNDEYHARETATARVTASEKKVGDLQKELRRLEDAYYAENDPNYRDSTIEPRFNQTKKQLDVARKELADARDAQQKVTGKPSS